MKIADLTPAMKGRIICLKTSDGVTISGPLRAIHLETEWAEDTPISGERKRIPSYSSLTIGVGRWSTDSLDPETPVEMLS